MKLWKLPLAGVVFASIGCAPDSEVTQSDVEKNQREFSQESYEQAMIRAGKGAELEEEKKRNAAHLAGTEGGQ